MKVDCCFLFLDNTENVCLLKITNYFSGLTDIVYNSNSSITNSCLLYVFFLLFLFINDWFHGANSTFLHLNFLKTNNKKKAYFCADFFLTKQNKNVKVGFPPQMLLMRYICVSVFLKIPRIEYIPPENFFLR